MTALLHDVATARPDDPAIVDDRGTLTWSELDERVNRLIHALRARGLAEGDSIAVMAGNQRELFEVSLAAHAGRLAGRARELALVADELAYIVDDAGARRSWSTTGGSTSASTPRRAPRALVARIAVSDQPPEGFESYDAVLADAPADEPPDQVKGGPMFYTSGTTGFPKGVRGGLATTGGPVELWQLIAAGFGEMMEVPGDGVGAARVRSGVPLCAVGVRHVPAAAGRHGRDPAPLRRGRAC